MSQLKLTADGGGGTVAIKGPASTTGNNDFELTVPGTASTTLDTLNRAGNILQVVQFRKTDTFSSSQNGFVDIGVAVDITPVAAGSKILITASYSGYSHQPSGGAGKIVRTIGGTAQDIGKADAASSRNVSSFSGHLYTANGSDSDYISLIANTQILDTPSYSVGNTINYKIQCHPENSTLRINYQETDDNNTTNGNRTTSYITCMEVAA